MYPFVIVFLGAGLGGALRHGINVGSAKILGLSFPYGTLAVNLLGCLIMGLLVEWFSLRADPGQHWRLFLSTGILGGFTTFSTFSLDAVNMLDRGQSVHAFLYIAMSLLLGIAALFIGMQVVRAM